MHKLTILNNRVFLDGMELREVSEYELKSSVASQTATELTLKLHVSTSEVSSGNEDGVMPWRIAKIDLLE